MSRSRLVAAAPAVFVLLWSTGFVGARYGLPYADPLIFLGVRLAIAAGLLGAVAAVTRSPLPAGRRAYASAAAAGVLLHAGYLGGVFWAISRGVPAGVSAVIVSLQPVVTAALGVRVLHEPLRVRQWMGLVLGFVGVAVVVAPNLDAAGDRGLPTAGVVACLVALAAQTAGTLVQKRFGGSVPLLSGTAVQYAAATVVLLAGALLTEDLHIEWTARFAVAMAWLVLVLSLGAVLLLLLLLRRGTAAGVSSLFYLVPPVTALEAYLVLHERLSASALVGLAVTAAGVALAVVRAPVQRAGSTP